MSISKELIEKEKKAHEDTLKGLNDQLNKLNFEIGSVKSNINAITGAIQQCNRFLEELSEEKVDEKV